MADPKDLKIGMQVAMVPSHAKGDLNHPDVQMGFVTALNDNFAFCRYFLHKSDELRTHSHSEGTAYECLVIHEHHLQSIINTYLVGLYPEYASRPELRAAATAYGIVFDDADPDEYQDDQDMGMSSCSDAVDFGEELCGW